jgi:hypothetical protein
VWGGKPATRRVGCVGVVGFLLVDSMPLCVLWGCGWVEHEDQKPAGWCCVGGFGTLLGPEGTPAGWWVFFLVAASGS